MTAITFRSPVTKTLLRAGTAKPVPPDPRAYDTFRVTQQFDTLDSYWADIDRRAGRTPRTHQATDIGNFRCGDPIVAMAAGVAYRVKDNATALGAPTDALGIRIDHGSGISTEMWHLDGYTVLHGQRVTAGQQVGIVGDTGLKAVCHCHVEVKRNGVKFDPEPLMFGGSVTVDDEEEDVKIPAGLKHLTQGIVGSGNRLRRDPANIEGSKVLSSTIFVQVYGLGVKGEPYTLGSGPGDDYAWIGAYGETWFVAQPLVTDSQLTPTGQGVIPETDCSRLENKLDGIATAARGLVQAATAIEGLATR